MRRIVLVLGLACSAREADPEDTGTVAETDARDTDVDVPPDTDAVDTEEPEESDAPIESDSPDSPPDTEPEEDTDPPPDPCAGSPDADGDGVTVCGPDGLASTGDEDCDDGDREVFPAAPERCNGTDDDCDGGLDEDCFPTLVYATTATTRGNLGGRAGADALCEAARPVGLSCGAARAVVSVSQADEVRDFTALYGFQGDAPVYGFHRGTQVATRMFDRWAQVSDRTVDPKVSRAVATGEGGLVWTGTDIDGALVNATRSHCRGWTFDGTGYPAAVNYGANAQANVDSGMAAGGFEPGDFLWTSVPFSDVRDTYGISTCCYDGSTTACPQTCPVDTRNTALVLMCSVQAKLMCACKASTAGLLDAP